MMPSPLSKSRGRVLLLRLPSSNAVSYQTDLCAGRLRCLYDFYCYRCVSSHDFSSVLMAGFVFLSESSEEE